MSVYTVHQPPIARDRSSRRSGAFRVRPRRLLFLGVSAPPLWMLWHRLWLVLLIYVIVAAGVQNAVHFAGVGVAAVHWPCCSSLSWLASRRARYAALRWRGAAGGRWASSAAPMPKPRSGDFRRLGRRGARQTGEPPASPPAPPPPLPHTPDDRRIVSGTQGVAVTVAIVDYGSGNLHSAAKAFERAARDSRHRPADRRDQRSGRRCAAERVVLPGVGAFADCRRGLDAVDGMVEALEEAVHRTRPAVFRHLRRHAIAGRARARI